MGKLRVLVVDDSPFSQMVVKQALPADIFEICGVAETGREGVAMYRTLQPDAVTMDVNMPDMDGLTCSRKILDFDPEARILLLSSMRDEALVAQGKMIGISIFLQKPVNAVVLQDNIIQMCAVEQGKRKTWQEKYVEYFSIALKDSLMKMAKLTCETEFLNVQGNKFDSQGLAIIIGLTGTRQGRVIVDVSQQTAKLFTQKIFGREDVGEDDVLHCMAEFANIICGRSVSQINDIYKGLETRVTPPSILVGEELSVVNPKLTSYSVAVGTLIGQIKLSVGFVGGN